MKDRITSLQLAVVITSASIGVVYISIPRIIGEVAGRDGWLTILGTGGMVLGLTWVLVQLCLRFPRQTATQFIPLVAGRWAGGLLVWGFVLYFILASAYIIRSFSDAMKLFLLPYTPLEVVVIVQVLTGAYLVGHGVNVLARSMQVFFPLILLPMGIILLLAVVDFRPSELLPVLADGVAPVVRAVPQAFWALLGFEVLLFLVAYLHYPRRDALRSALVGAAIPVVLYLVIFVITIGALGPALSKQQILPVIDLARSIDIPGTFVERLEVFLLALWVVTAFSSATVYHYLAALAASQLLALKEHRPLVYLLPPLIYLAAMRPSNITVEMAMGKVISWLGMGLVIGTALLLPMAIITGKKGTAEPDGGQGGPGGSNGQQGKGVESTAQGAGGRQGRAADLGGQARQEKGEGLQGGGESNGLIDQAGAGRVWEKGGMQDGRKKE